MIRVLDGFIHFPFFPMLHSLISFDVAIKHLIKQFLSEKKYMITI